MSREREQEAVIKSYNGSQGAIITEEDEKFILGVPTATVIQRHKVGEEVLELIKTGTPLKGTVVELPETSWARKEGFKGIFFPDDEFGFP